MCTIASHNGKTRITLEEWRAAWRQNPDGGGLAWVAGGKVHTYRSLDRDELRARYEAALKEGAAAILVHMRIATHGSVCLENCHPFVVLEGRQVIAHNGVLSQLTTELEPNESDSRAFVRLVLQHLPADWPTNFGMVELVSDYLNGDRLAVMSADCEPPVLLFGDWEKAKDGIEWSNRYHKRTPNTLTGWGGEGHGGREYRSWQEWADEKGWSDAPCYHCGRHVGHADDCEAIGPGSPQVRASVQSWKDSHCPDCSRTWKACTCEDDASDGDGMPLWKDGGKL